MVTIRTNSEENITVKLIKGMRVKLISMKEIDLQAERTGYHIKGLHLGCEGTITKDESPIDGLAMCLFDSCYMWINSAMVEVV